MWERSDGAVATIRAKVPVADPERADPLRFLRTPSGPTWAAPGDRKVYLVWIGLVWAGMIAGFLPDMTRYLGEAPPPPFILHFHGAVYFAWLALVTTQIILIEVRKPALHRRLGWAVVVLSAAMVPLAFVAAMVDQARQSGHHNFAPHAGLPGLLGMRDARRVEIFPRTNA